MIPPATQEAALPPPKPLRALANTALGCFKDMQLMETIVGRSLSRESELAQHWRATSCTVRDFPVGVRRVILI
jgi:hypothetical protein